jgi:thiol:disulfide interchange protein DsbD
MLPITVSFFLKQAEREHHNPLQLAIVYCGTIVVVLTFGAVVLLGFFQALSQHWLTNFLIGVLFLTFSLSLFGLFEIRLPSKLSNFTAAREGQGGLIGTVFMALTFTIISFTCVAPFLGGFAGTSVQSRPFYQVVLGGLAFAATFASPFFFLALFPSWLKSMPKSGAWMNSVKVVMGFLELVAGLTFLRGGELVAFGEATFFTYDLVLAGYVATSLLCGLYLLNVFRLPHDDAPPESIGVIRLMFSFLFLCLGFYLAPGLFKVNSADKQRPAGVVFNWIDAFILPDETPGGARTQLAGNGNQNPEADSGLNWLGNLNKGLEQAWQKRQENVPRNLVFIDFTGLT